MMLVTITQARQHLRSDTDVDDADLALKVEAASEAIIHHLMDTELDWTDSAGYPFEDTAGIAIGVPKRVQSACLMLTAYYYNERDGSNNNPVPSQYGFGYFPVGVEAMLFPIRKPVVS